MFYSIRMIEIFNRSHQNAEVNFPIVLYPYEFYNKNKLQIFINNSNASE